MCILNHANTELRDNFYNPSQPCLLAGLCKYYWLAFHGKNKKMGLTST